jgi:hypothetical protein
MREGTCTTSQGFLLGCPPVALSFSSVGFQPQKFNYSSAVVIKYSVFLAVVQILKNKQPSSSPYTLCPASSIIDSGSNY